MSLPSKFGLPLCKRFRLWNKDQHQKLLVPLVAVKRFEPEHAFFPFMKIVMAIVNGSNIGFHSLSERQQAMLVGSDIGKAIFNMRVKLLEEAL